MFKAIKEFFFGKSLPVVRDAPYKIEPPVAEAKPAMPDTVPVPPPVVEVAPAAPLNPVQHEWPKAETVAAPVVKEEVKKAAPKKPKATAPKAPKEPKAPRKPKAEGKKKADKPQQ